MNFTTEQLLAMAEQCGFGRMIKIGSLPPVWHGQDIKMLERFADLAAEAAIKAAPEYKMGYADGAAAEREACLHAAEVAASLLEDPIAAIRARGKK